MKEQDSKQMKEIGERIRSTRRNQKMTQEDLAFSIGITTTRISKIENGQTITKINTFSRIADALQVSADYLLRAETPQATKLTKGEIIELLDSCTVYELQMAKKAIELVLDSIRGTVGSAAK